MKIEDIVEEVKGRDVYWPDGSSTPNVSEGELVANMRQGIYPLIVKRVNEEYAVSVTVTSYQPNVKQEDVAAFAKRLTCA